MSLNFIDELTNCYPPANNECPGYYGPYKIPGNENKIADHRQEGGKSRVMKGREGPGQVTRSGGRPPGLRCYCPPAGFPVSARALHSDLFSELSKVWF